jgi:DNA-binding GntR family transcriptional regulator/anti-sigma regulatory factor (Ser/Thr protein kinase)
MAEARLSRTESAYRHLARDVLRGRWSPGETVSTYALAAELGMSRTPVAQAFKRLEAEGLVEVIPQVGSRIVGPNPGPVDELFALRAALEGAAAAAAARKISDAQLDELEVTLERLERAAAVGDGLAYVELYEQFRARIVAAAAIPQLAEAARSIWTPLRHRLADPPLPVGGLAESARELREIYAALRRRASARARTATEGHVKRAASRFLVPLRAAQGGGLRHQALLYSGDAEFLASTVPFIEQGLELDERVLAVTTPANRELLTHALGRRVQAVEFRDSDDWYELPSHTLLSYERYIQFSDRPRARIVGEVAWKDTSGAELAEWTRYEAILNVAFALEPVSIMCPYDIRRLPPTVVADAHRTHPEIARDGRSSPSTKFADVGRLTLELDHTELSAPGVPVTTQAITADLRDARDFILEHARRAGVSGKTLQDAFLAVQEAAASVVFHGPGHGTISAWVEDGELIYEVSDTGSGSSDPLAGQLVVDPILLSEPRGLWLPRLLCDLVEARSHNGGLVVRLHIAAPG